MPWLKKQQPIQLYQSSDLPYVILDKGVCLCYDNCYGTKPDNAEFNLCFRSSSVNLRRINTHFYRLSQFPSIIPFSHIVSLDDTIIEGRTIKHVASKTNEPKSIAVVNASYIRTISDTKLSKLSDTLADEFDHSFTLVGEVIDPQVRLFSGTTSLIPHRSWFRTAVTIAHSLSAASHRKYCWTRNVPDLSISCYGIIDSDELQEISGAFEFIGIDNISTTWVN